MIVNAIFHFVVENWLELAGFLTTAAGIWLTARRLLICWPVTLAADVLYLVVFFRAHLLSDTLLQVFFVGFTLYGWWHWWRGVVSEGSVRVVPLRSSALWIGIGAAAAGSIPLGIVAVHYHASLPFLDAALTSFSLLGCWWQARKHIANWWLWIVVDLVYIGEYAYKALWLTAVLSAILVVLAVIGLREWQSAPSEVQTAV